MAFDSEKNRQAASVISPIGTPFASEWADGDITAKDRSQIAGSYRFELAPPEPPGSEDNWVAVGIKANNRRGGS